MRKIFRTKTEMVWLSSSCVSGLFCIVGFVRGQVTTSFVPQGVAGQKSRIRILPLPAGRLAGGPELLPILVHQTAWPAVAVTRTRPGNCTRVTPQTVPDKKAIRTRNNRRNIDAENPGAEAVDKANQKGLGKLNKKDTATNVRLGRTESSMAIDC